MVLVGKVGDFCIPSEHPSLIYSCTDFKLKSTVRNKVPVSKCAIQNSLLEENVLIVTDFSKQCCSGLTESHISYRLQKVNSGKQAILGYIYRYRRLGQFFGLLSKILKAPVFSVWTWPALDSNPKAAHSRCSRCLEQQSQFSIHSCKGSPHRGSWGVILGGEFREIGVLSGA